MTFTNPSRPLNSSRASSLSGRLAVVASDAERLQVGSVKACTTLFDRYDMVDDLGCNQAPCRFTTHAQGLVTQ